MWEDKLYNVNQYSRRCLGYGLFRNHEMVFYLRSQTPKQKKPQRYKSLICQATINTTSIYPPTRTGGRPAGKRQWHGMHRTGVAKNIDGMESPLAELKNDDLGKRNGGA